jgi:hypothetical protein
MNPVLAFSMVPLQDPISPQQITVNGKECITSTVDPSAIFYGSEHTYSQLCNVLEALGERALTGNFKRCQVAATVTYPDAKVALLVATFDIGTPMEIKEPPETRR